MFAGNVRMVSVRFSRFAAAAAVMVLAAGCGGAERKTDQAAVGAPVGHTGHASGAPESAPLRSGERFVDLAMPNPYTPVPPNGGTDVYRCFLLDPALTSKAFLTGSQFLPQNAQVLHHAIFFRVPPDDLADARRLDAESPGDGWTCFGGTGIGSKGSAASQLRGGLGWVGAWAPGGREGLAADGTGYEMPAGSQIVLQVHYNLLATGGKAAGADRSGIKLRLVDGSAKLAPLQTGLYPAPVELPCATGESGALCDRASSILDVRARFGTNAGARVEGLNWLCNGAKPPVAGPTQRCDRTIREAGTIYSVAGHMHLLGRSIKVELNPGTATAQTLLDVPVYNFDDQGARRLPTPVWVKPNDVIRVTCTHDATLRAKLPALRTLQPRYVVWGEGTSDEMCLAITVWTRSS